MCVCFTCRIYGYDTFPYEKFRVINLNMSQLNISQCDDDKDYVTWMPTDGVCIIMITFELLIKHQCNKLKIKTIYFRCKGD